MAQSTQLDKAHALIGQHRIVRTGLTTFVAYGNGGAYDVEFAKRAVRCQCKAGFWSRGNIKKYGKIACYHLRAAKEMLRQDAPIVQITTPVAAGEWGTEA